MGLAWVVLISGFAAAAPANSAKAAPDLAATALVPARNIAIDRVTGAVHRRPYDIFTIGAGRLDVPAALTGHMPFAGAALSPAARVDAAGEVLATADSGSGGERMGGFSAAWGSSAAAGE